MGMSGSTEQSDHGAGGDSGTAAAFVGAFALSRTAVFLDFDGTLVDIAPRPDAVQVPPDLPDLLDRLAAATGGAMAIVTGRDIDSVERMVPGFRGLVSGGHGADLRLADGTRRRHRLAGSDTLAQITDEVTRYAATHDLLAEPKPTGIVLHFRQKPEAGPAVRGLMEGLAADFPDVELHPAKMAWELRPGDVGKDVALDRLMERAPFADRQPVMFGDDTADEAAMVAAIRQGGSAVKIGDGSSAAPYRVADPTGARALLSRWLDVAD